MPLKPARFLDPKSDVVFKKVFGQNPDLIKSFLNSILPLPSPIETLSYLAAEQSPTIPTMKNTIVDVKCTDEQGRVFVVEMQLLWSETFKKRLTFGASKAYVQQLDKGEEYRSLCPVYGLGIINEVFDHQTEEWFHHYKTINIKNTEDVLEGLELIFIELPKFKPSTFTQKKVGILWLRFLSELNEKLQEVPEDFDTNPEVMKAMELVQESAYTKAELEAYDRYWDAVSVEKTVRGDAFDQGVKQGIEKGIQEGIEKGLQEGIEKGLQEGIEKGKREAMLGVARTLLFQKMSLDQVSGLTGLSIAELQALAN